MESSNESSVAVLGTRALSSPGKEHALRVTERDFSLICAVCLGRFLSFTQLRRLFFSHATEAVARKRLRELTGAGRRPARPPLLQSVPFRHLDGRVETAYLLTDAGYVLASDKLQRAINPPDVRGRVEFILHQLGLNDAFVELALKTMKPGAPHPDFRRLPFIWRPGHTLHLPWQERNLGVPVLRLLSPDAVLELPEQRLRLFLEFETGAHTIVPRSSRKQGATLIKAKRYGRYIFRKHLEGGEETAYSVAFPDRFAPKLIFIAAREVRARSIAAALAKAAKEQDISRDLKTAAFTCSEFAEFVTASSSLAIRHAEQRASPSRELLRRFYVEAVQSIKAARAHVRDVNARHGMTLPLPEYPSSSNQVIAMLGLAHGKG